MLTVEPVQPDIHNTIPPSNSTKPPINKHTSHKNKNHAIQLFANISLVELFEDSVLLDIALKYVLELSTNNS